jgi:hypothetical protein
MKTHIKTNTLKKPLHMHIEHISRMPILLAAVAGLFMVALLKSDSKTLGIVRQAYAERVEYVNSYMRQETVHGLTSVTASRPTVISGK